MKDWNAELIDLLLQRASVGLSEEEEQRLGQLLESEGLDDSDELDLAVAAAANALALEQGGGAELDVPASLMEKLIMDADRFFDGKDGGGTVTSLDRARSKAVSRRRTVQSPWIGWSVAATLAVALLVTLLPGDGLRDSDPDIIAARSALIKESPQTTVTPWARPDSAAYASVTGDVVWNDARQEGYMRLAGMPVNDPSTTQYQLWIVDSDRDERPVDGGVFDIPPGVSEVVIPIDAKLRVSQPEAFAITREKPGGVVVSAGPLLVVASSG